MNQYWAKDYAVADSKASVHSKLPNQQVVYAPGYGHDFQLLSWWYTVTVVVVDMVNSEGDTGFGVAVVWYAV